MESEVAARLRAALQERGMSQAALAQRVGVTKAAVHGWLNDGGVSLANLVRIAEVLDVSINYLLGADDPKGVPVRGSLNGGLVALSGDRLRAPARDPKAYGIHVDTADLDPRYRVGEVLVVYPSYAPSPGDDVLLLEHGEDRPRVLSLVSSTDAAVVVAPVLGGARERLPRETLAFVHTVAGAFRGEDVISG